MLEFQKYKLEEICNIQIGKTPRREIAKYWGKGYSWVSISDMKSNLIISTKEQITETAIKECGCRLIPKGTLLLSFKLSIGKLSFAGKDLFTNEAIASLLIKDTKILHPEYLYFVLKNIPLVGSNNAAMGSTLNKESLRILEIPVPKRIEDQKYIVKLLSQGESLIAQRKESILLLDELLKSTFLDKFGKYLTNKTHTKLEDIASITSGLTKGKNYEGKKTSFIPYMRVANVQDGYLDLTEIKEIEATNEEIERYNLKSGDLLLTEGGDPDKLGRGTIWKNEIKRCIFQNHIFRVRITSDKVIPVFLSFLTGSFYGKKYFLKSAKQTTGIASINSTQLKSFPAFTPPIKLQRQFTQIVEEVQVQKLIFIKSLQQLESLYGSLSQRAFKGELFTSSQIEAASVQELQELEDKYFIKRKVLATYIINQSLNDSLFGDVKFEKLLHLSDYFAIKRNLNQKYLQKAAGPYDNAFTIPFFNQIETSKWFTRNKSGAQYIFKPGKNHEKSINTYGYFDDEELLKVNRLISYFKKSDYEQPEIISTLYAVWNNRIIKQQSITDELLKGDFLSWDTQKIKYKDRLDSALKWMRKEGLVPDGWGKVIEKPKLKRNGK